MRAVCVDIKFGETKSDEKRPEDGMGENPTRGKFSFRRILPILIVLAVAAVGYFTLGDQVSFETLKENRESLVGFRDANYLLTSAVFIIVYVIIVAFSLPGAAVASLTGGFLFQLFPGALYNIVAATIGATAIFTAARFGLGDYLSKKNGRGQWHRSKD